MIKLKQLKISLNSRWYLEVYVPIFSICGLIAVTVWIACEAITVIMDPGERIQMYMPVTY
jgi:hypothetical protein